MFHVNNSERSFSNTSDNNQLETDDEEGFTDLRFCEAPIDTDSESSRSNSPVILKSEQSDRFLGSSSSSKQNNLQTKKNADRSEKNTVQQFTTTSHSSKPYHLKSFDDLFHLLQKDSYRFLFSAVPKENSNYMQCRLIRDQTSFSETFYLEVELENSDETITLLTAEKESKIMGQTEYLISLNSNFENDLCPAQLLCNNVTGTKYILYDLNGVERQVLASILYESNFLGLKGPRKINVLLPTIDHQMEDLCKETNQIEEYSSDNHTESFVRSFNKPPIWDEEMDSYILHFEGKNRITMPSIKNFQMVVEDQNHVEQVVMEFGRMSENVFSCDFRYPLSFVQAFSIGLSSFETRLFRE